MSRSYRKTPILPINTSDTEKQDKRFARRKLRRRINQALQAGVDPEAYYPPLLREVSDIWTMDKDGKCHYDLSDLAEWIKPWQIKGK